MPLATLISAAVWAVTFFASRYVSLASILASVALPVAAVPFADRWQRLFGWLNALLLAVMAAAAVVAPRGAASDPAYPGFAKALASSGLPLLLGGRLLLVDGLVDLRLGDVLASHLRGHAIGEAAAPAPAEGDEAEGPGDGEAGDDSREAVHGAGL
jgi:hypothetical protein